MKPPRKKKTKRKDDYEGVLKGERPTMYYPPMPEEALQVELPKPENDKTISENDQPSGMEMMVKNFSNQCSSSDPNTRIANLRNIIVFTSPWHQTNLPQRPSYASAMLEAKARMRPSFIGTDKMLEEAVLQNGLVNVIIGNRYEELLSAAVIEALRTLQTNGFLRWTEFPPEGQPKTFLSKGSDGRTYHGQVLR